MDKPDKADTAASLLLGVVVIAAVAMYFAWSDIVRMTADAHDEHTTLWLETTDVAAGETIEGRVHVQAGMRIAIRGVIVSGAGDEQVLPGHVPHWGDQITAGRFYDRELARDELAFAVRIPGDARPGEVLHLELAIEYVTAEREYVHHGFSNREHVSTFRIDVPIHSAAMSAARRAGKAALAIAAWLAVVMTCVAGSRWYGRRRRTPGAAWLWLLIPYTLAGWFGFAWLVGDATRLHGLGFRIGALIVWFLAFAAWSRVTAGDTVRRYLVRQARIPVPGGDAYRSGGAQVPTRSLEEMVAAFEAAGLYVERKRTELLVTRFGTGTALVRLPAAGSFGGGEPFELRSEHEAVVTAIVAAASEALGELRYHLADAGKLGDGPAALEA